ncbi:MAG: cysteine--tRNA ligase [Candidatus Omnitrophica bacterium]|nr:cysteine--tRNA ligase [Candidatus Omnitrophota bacterium]
MTIKIYNSQTSKKEEFNRKPPEKVNMYTCGVTVYDACHIGHARSLYVFQVMRRYLKFRGYDITLVRNITDVDDKIINKARDWAKRDKLSLIEAFDKVRNFYIDDYYDDLKALGLPKADIEPRATENIKEIIAYIVKLIEKGFAYEKNGNVYFSPRKLDNYGSLSGNSLDEVQEAVKIEADSDKKDPVDFALWKKVKEAEPSWDSPWGKGRPGWHIECSVMSREYLGVDTLDIHGGGRDLIFPHHENEKAQSEALTGKKFANYWIHHGLLTINAQKMAKSAGNFVTIKDVLKKYPADILKIFYLQAHYSSSIDFSWEKMEEAKKAYERIRILLEKLEKKYGNKDVTKVISGGTGEEVMLAFYNRFIESMDDDFNMPKGLAVLFDMVSRCNKLFESDEEYKDLMLRDAFEKIKKLANIFELTFLKQKTSSLPDEQIEEKIALRLKYKKDRDFKSADGIRDELQNIGIIIEDTKGGKTTWRIS